MDCIYIALLHILVNTRMLTHIHTDARDAIHFGKCGFKSNVENLQVAGPMCHL